MALLPVRISGDGSLVRESASIRASHAIPRRGLRLRLFRIPFDLPCGCVVQNLSLSIAMEILCVATAGGLFALGPGFIEKQFREAWTGSFKNYGRIWQEQSRWTLLGVVSSEATSNAHSYAVAFLAGPAAFAPIAAAMLLVKPVLMVITSFTQLERPVMVRHLTSGDPIAALRTVETFRLTAILTWIATIAAGSAVLVWFPRLLFKSSFDLGTVPVAFILWACISLLQSLATPASVLLQAAQWFRRLGWAGRCRWRVDNSRPCGCFFSASLDLARDSGWTVHDEPEPLHSHEAMDHS